MTIGTRTAAILLTIAFTTLTGPTAADERRTIFIPGRVEVAADRVPTDIQAAILASSRAAKGENDLSGGLGIAKLRHGATIARQGLPLERDYFVERVNLMSIVTGSSPGERKIFGQIDFVRPGGLRAQIAFLTDYTADKSGLIINNI